MTRVLAPSRPVGRDGSPLGARLRRETRADHLAAEAAFDLPRRVGGREAYAEVLVVLDAFHRACAPALEAGAWELPAGLRDGPARRRARLTDDLATLGRETGPGVVAIEPLDAAPDGALGVWYVHEGAALGGLMIAAEARRRLPEVAGATTFFTGEGRATAARWRTFHTVLGARCDDDALADRAVAGARTAFTVLTAALAGAPA